MLILYYWDLNICLSEFSYIKSSPLTCDSTTYSFAIMLSLCPQIALIKSDSTRVREQYNSCWERWKSQKVGHLAGYAIIQGISQVLEFDKVFLLKDWLNFFYFNLNKLGFIKQDVDVKITWPPSKISHTRRKHISFIFKFSIWNQFINSW